MNKMYDFYYVCKRKFTSKFFLLFFFLFLLTIVTFFSYAIFMVSTGKYRASEMFIANLIYGINITDSDNTSTINGKQVTVGIGTTEIVNVTLTSLNPIDSNYKLQYKVIEGKLQYKVIEGEGEVYYSDKTNWKPYGSISKSNEGIYVKTIKVVIENTRTSELRVELGASGGYIYNSLISGYTGITEEKSTIVAIENGELITEIVESDTGCETEESGVCIYGGETENNYVQYPESSNKSENIWRIIGTYNIDGEVVVKMISETATTSTYAESVNNLNSYIRKQ